MSDAVRTTWFHRLRHTPMRDVLRGRLRTWIMQLLNSATLPLVASRRDILNWYDLYLDKRQADLYLPIRQVQPDGFDEQLRAWRASLPAIIRYAPLNAFAPSLNKVQTIAERLLGQRDGILVGIALELYHREHRTYPAALTELTPRWLPAVPLDRITGEPVKYRLIDGKPHVYSVGVDRIDNGGVPVMNRGITPVPHAAAEWNSGSTRQLPQADWPLYPVPAPPVEDEE